MKELVVGCWKTLLRDEIKEKYFNNVIVPEIEEHLTMGAKGIEYEIEYCRYKLKKVKNNLIYTELIKDLWKLLEKYRNGGKEMKVYLVVGTHISSASIFSSISNYGVKSDYESAEKELDIIENEIVKDCKENETEIISKHREKGFMRFVYDNDDEESYEIIERIIDLKEGK